MRNEKGKRLGCYYKNKFRTLKMDPRDPEKIIEI